MDKKLVFISHITEDKEYAKSIKEWLDHAFLNAIQFFVSSDNSSMPIGKDWANEVKTHLEKASIMFVIISELSVERKWLYFESGSAYIKNIPIIPICVNGFKISKLSPPFSFFQGIELPNETNEKKLLEVLAKVVDLYVPNPPSQLELLEREYEKSISSSNTFLEIIDDLPLTKRNTLQLFNNLNPDITQTINELFYVINLYSASGNCSKVEELIMEMQKTFSTSKLISKIGFAEIVDKIRESNELFIPKEDRKDEWGQGYDRVSNILPIILNQLPSEQECKRRILNYPIEIWLTAMSYYYYFGFSFRVYHNYWFREKCFDEMLIDKENGKIILPIIEDLLIKTRIDSEFYNKLILTGRAFKGKDFDNWFVGLKGMTLDEERKREQEREIAEQEMKLKREQFDMEREKLYIEKRKMERENNEKQSANINSNDSE